MVEMAIFNVHRAITPKVGNSELWFMRPAHRLMMLYIYVKFHDNTLNDFQLTEGTQVHGRNGYILCLKGNNSTTRIPKVMVHAFCISSHGVCDVS